MIRIHRDVAIINTRDGPDIKLAGYPDIWSADIQQRLATKIDIRADTGTQSGYPLHYKPVLGR